MPAPRLIRPSRSMNRSGSNKMMLIYSIILILVAGVVFIFLQANEKLAATQADQIRLSEKSAHPEEIPKINYENIVLRGSVYEMPKLAETMHPSVPVASQTEQPRELVLTGKIEALKHDELELNVLRFNSVTHRTDRP